jgi:hypothetical protein
VPLLPSIESLILLPSIESLILLSHENILIFGRHEFGSLLETDDNRSASGQGCLLDVPSSFIY